MKQLTVGDLHPSFVRSPVSGLAFDSEVATAERPLLLVFLRHPGGATTRRVVAELSAEFASLDRAGVAVVVVMRGAEAAIRDFVPRNHLLFPVIHDEHGSLFATYRVAGDQMFMGTLSRPWRLLKAFGTDRGGPGTADQLPAAFVIAPGGSIEHSWYGRSVMDEAPLPELIDAAKRVIS